MFPKVQDLTRFNAMPIFATRSGNGHVTPSPTPGKVKILTDVQIEDDLF